MSVRKLGDGLYLIDLEFQGCAGVIAAYLIEDGGERALIETGPTSTLDTLLAGLHEAGIQPESISKLIATHIHLDHAGASGTWLMRFPEAHLYVHEIGVPHMVDPSKLLASASRIWGDLMGPLWGDVEPVPQNSITALGDGDTVSVGNKRLGVVYTPGHASHHVAFHDPERDLVFTGDVAAARIQGMSYVRPPTPPPDLDLEAWEQSLERIRDLKPRSLNLTHFGPFEDVERHLQETRRRLRDWAEIVRSAMESGQDKPEIVDALAFHENAEIMAETDDAEILQQYELATPYGMSVDGYLRYFRGKSRS